MFYSSFYAWLNVREIWRRVIQQFLSTSMVAFRRSISICISYSWSFSCFTSSEDDIAVFGYSVQVEHPARFELSSRNARVEQWHRENRSRVLAICYPCVQRLFRRISQPANDLCDWLCCIIHCKCLFLLLPCVHNPFLSPCPGFCPQGRSFLNFCYTFWGTSILQCRFFNYRYHLPHLISNMLFWTGSIRKRRASAIQ